MKQLTKLIAGVLLILAAMTMPAFATESMDEITLLSRLDVIRGYEDGQLHPEQSITRMEFAALLVRCLGLEHAGLGMETGFPDISPDSWGAGYVKAAKDLGLIEGYADGTFGPEDKIIITDAAKMIVSAMGYSIWAKDIGGYPWGYLRVAQEIGTLDGIAGFEAQATRADIAKMLYNSLEIEFMDGGATLLQCMHITKLEGRLTAIYGMGLDESYRALDQDEIVVSERKFRVSQPVDAAYMGMEVYTYVRDYDDAGEVALLVLPRRDANMLVVRAEDIDARTTLSEFYYWDGKRDQKVRLPEQLQMIYNGSAIATTSQLTAERLKPESGSVTFVDTNGDGSYESVYVKDYTTYVVQGIREDAIYDIYGNNFRIDQKAEVTIMKEGEYLSLEDLKNGDVLSVAASLDGNRIEMIVSNAKTEGQVTQSASGGNGRSYYILDDNEAVHYSRTKSYEKALESGYKQALDFDLGDTVVFYLNAFGEIAQAERSGDSQDEYSYGYLLGLTMKKGGLDGNCLLQVITEDNRVETLRTAPERRVTFGRRSGGKYDVSRVDAQEIADVIGMDDKATAQLIRYKTDGNGDVKELYLLDRNNTENFSVSVTRGSRNFAYHAIQNTWYFDENTAVFHIPSSGLYPERISAGTPSRYFSNNTGYSVTLYDVDDDGYVNLIVYHAAVTYYDDVYINYANSPVMLVTDVYTSMDEAGDAHLTVEGYQDGKKVKQYVSGQLSAAQISRDIRPGVVMQYAVSSGLTGYAMTWDEEVGIILYNVIYDCNDKEQGNFQMWNYGTMYAANARIQCACGQVTRVDMPMVRTDLNAENSSNKQLFELRDDASYYRYSTTKQQFEKVGLEEVRETDKIFVRTRYNCLKELIIIE